MQMKTDMHNDIGQIIQTRRGMATRVTVERYIYFTEKHEFQINKQFPRKRPKIKHPGNLNTTKNDN